MIHFAAIASPINDIADSLGANNLPYAIPLHPNLVHLTIGLFAIAIAFDVAGAFYPLEKRVFRYLALPVTRSGFHDVGWYNLVACSWPQNATVAATGVPWESTTTTGETRTSVFPWATFRPPVAYCRTHCLPSRHRCSRW